MRLTSKPVWIPHRGFSSSSFPDFIAFVPGPYKMRLECRPLVELNTGCVKVHEDCPNQKRRRVVGKQPPPRVWQKVICPMHNMQSDCLIYVLELACEFLPERKWCRILNKDTCEHYDTRTRVVLWNNDAPGLKVEEFLKELLEEVPESLKRLDDPEETEAQAWHRYITMSEFELSVARRYRVPCQLLFFFGLHLQRKGYYQVAVPICHFRQLRSTGWFKEQLLHFQREFFDYFNVPFRSVLNEFVERKHRRNNRLAKIAQKERGYRRIWVFVTNFLEWL